MPKTKTKKRENRITVELDDDLAAVVHGKCKPHGRGAITLLVNAALRNHFGKPDPKAELVKGTSMTE